MGPHGGRSAAGKSIMGIQSTHVKPENPELQGRWYANCLHARMNKPRAKKPGPMRARDDEPKEWGGL